MDDTDKNILDLMKGNARISWEELGKALGMSRVAARKRVKKLEQDGIICGYNTYIHREEEKTVLIDLVTLPDRYDDVLKYVSTRTAFVRQIYRTTKANHIHMVAVSDDVQSLNYLIRIIKNKCGDALTEIHVHAVKEIVKDVYGGIRYDEVSGGDRSETKSRPLSDSERNNEPA